MTVQYADGVIPAKAKAKKRCWRADAVESLIHFVDAIAIRFGRTPKLAAHLATGVRGEEAAFFYLQREGYTIVSRNWRCSELRGDLDLIGWHDGFLCFIEVKTRTQRGNIAAEFAVNREKKQMLRRMARAYLKRSRNDRDRTPVRFDILSIYFIEKNAPRFELYQSAFSWH